MERTRVAKDGTNRPVVIRVCISIVSEALLVTMPSYGCDPVVGHPCLLKLADSSFPDAVVSKFLVRGVKLAQHSHVPHICVNGSYPHWL